MSEQKLTITKTDADLNKFPVSIEDFSRSVIIKQILELKKVKFYDRISDEITSR